MRNPIGARKLKSADDTLDSGGHVPTVANVLARGKAGLDVTGRARGYLIARGPKGDQRLGAGAKRRAQLMDDRLLTIRERKPLNPALHRLPAPSLPCPTAYWEIIA